MLASTPYNRHGSAQFEAQKNYADTSTIRNARLLLFPFHSPGAMEACERGVERRPRVQERIKLQTRHATMIQRPAVEVGKG
jgi:hypothetical protein